MDDNNIMDDNNLIQLLRGYGLLLILVEIGIYFMIKDDVYQTLFAQVVLYTLFIYFIICISVPSSKSFDFSEMTTVFNGDDNNNAKTPFDIKQDKMFSMFHGFGYFALIFLFISFFYESLETSNIIFIIILSHVLFGVIYIALTRVLDVENLRSVEKWFVLLWSIISGIGLIIFILFVVYLILKFSMKPASTLKFF